MTLQSLPNILGVKRQLDATNFIISLIDAGQFRPDKRRFNGRHIAAIATRQGFTYCPESTYTFILEDADLDLLRPDGQSRRTGVPAEDIIAARPRFIAARDDLQALYNRLMGLEITETRDYSEMQEIIESLDIDWG